MQRDSVKGLILAKIQSEIDVISTHTNQLVQKKVYLSDKEIVGLQAIKTIYRDIPIPQSDGGNHRVWVAFVDDVPEANWGHPCRYLFINEDGNISEVKSITPPSLKNPFTFEEIK
jgi:hypothetical protein